VKFSIVTPSLNQGKYIEKTIKSVLAQSGVDWEYIVVDGKSTDNTIEILNKYRNRIKYISEKDSGQSEAINKGFRLVKGEILGWLNSDDWYCEKALQKVEKYFKKHPDISIVYGDYAVSDKKGIILEVVKEIDFDRDIFLHGVNYICQPTVFFRREVLEKVGGLDEKLHLTMDLQFWLRVVHCGFNFGHIRSCLAVTRLHQESKSIKEKEKQLIETDIVFGHPRNRLFYRIKRQILRLFERGQINLLPRNIGKEWQ